MPAPFTIFRAGWETAFEGFLFVVVITVVVRFKVFGVSIINIIDINVFTFLSRRDFDEFLRALFIFVKNIVTTLVVTVLVIVIRRNVVIVIGVIPSFVIGVIPSFIFRTGVTLFYIPWYISFSVEDVTRI